MVTNKYNKRVWLLDNIIINLIAKNKILKYCVNRLTKAIYNKKKKYY